MLSDFQKQKLLHLFMSFDTDGDGFIEQKDLDATAERVAEGHGHAEDSQRREHLVTTYRAYWNQMASSLDYDKDAQISQEEFLGFFAKVAANPGGDEFSTVMTLCDMLFTSADRDGDGAIDENEFAVITTSYGVPKAQAKRVFCLLDQDGDGQLSKQEWPALVADMFLGNDPSTPASIMMMSVERAELQH